jgi:hypothetical protein
MAAYLMKSKGLGLEESLTKIRDLRPQIYPNAGFMGQLKTFSKAIKMESVMQTREARAAMKMITPAGSLGGYTKFVNNEAVAEPAFGKLF